MRISKKICFNFLLLFITKISLGQINLKNTAVIVGLEPSAGLSMVSKRAVGVIPRYWLLRLAPYISLKAHKNVYFGINYEHQFGKIEGNPFPTQNGLGIHFRYFFPIGNEDYLYKNRLKFYTSIEWLKLDHYLDANSVYGSSKLSNFRNNNFNLMIGLNVRLFGSWYTNFAAGPMFFTEGHPFLFGRRGAIEYHFGEKIVSHGGKKQREVRYNTEKRKALDLSYIFDKITLGGSYTFIWDDNNTSQKFYYRESTINLNIATSITSDIDLGMAILPIWTTSPSKGSERFLLFGIFVQYDFLRLASEKSRLFAETGFYKGNLCTCGEDVPFYHPNLIYIPFGGGYEMRVTKSIPLFFELSFQWFNILNNINIDKWAYSQYVIGINYRIP